jgi:hypothetical protein
MSQLEASRDAMRQGRPKTSSTQPAHDHLDVGLLVDLLIDADHHQHAKALRAGTAGADEAEALARQLASTAGLHRSAWMRWSAPLALAKDRPAVRRLVARLANG